VLRPFESVPYDELPELPRLPHGYEKTRGYERVVHSQHFGKHKVHVRELGDGPPLLLVHGLMTTSYSFRYVFEPLAKQFRVIAPDLPGAGNTDKVDVHLGAAAMAEWLFEFARTMDVVGAACIGNSMGGYLCMRAALTHPELFSCLVNEHSPGIVELRLRALSTVLALPGSERLLDALVKRDPKRWAHKNVHYYDESLKSLEEARMYGAPLSDPAGRRAFYHHLKDTMSAREMKQFVTDLTRMKREQRPFPTPLLLVYAEHDPMVPPRVGKILSALVPSAELIWLREGSHFAHIDRPRLFLNAALPFLQQHGHPG
jgi:pimeloyl-ACP methyl ester carboxylesterase